MSPDTLSLASKVAIVTGSGRENGIGAAIARALARNGAAVAIHHVSASSAARAAQVAQAIRAEGGKAAVIQANVTSHDGANTLVTATLKAFGVDKIDILGKRDLQPFERQDLTSSDSQQRRWCYILVSP